MQSQILTPSPFESFNIPPPPIPVIPSPPIHPSAPQMSSSHFNFTGVIDDTNKNNNTTTISVNAGDSKSVPSMSSSWSYFNNAGRGNHMVGHGYFGPQSTLGSCGPNYSTHTNNSGSWGNDCHDKRKQDKKVYKETVKNMREQWKEIKRGATTEEDKKRLKEIKGDMREEMKQARREAMINFKEMKLSDKKQRYVARHVEDVTIPDGTELPPNTPFIKTWKIRNEGPAWPPGSQLLFVSHKGDNLNGPERVTIKGDVKPGQEVEISVPLITPNEPGRYVGYYRMVTPDNIKFGQRVWVSFVVALPNQPAGYEVNNVDA